jgi:competence protein ComEC
MPVTGDLDVHFIDVGQGDAALILTPEGKAMLIDTGEASEKEFLIEYIRSANVETLDYLVLTHPHTDHMGGASAILEAFDVKTVMMPDAQSDTTTFLRLLEAIDRENCDLIIPEIKDTFSLGTAVITCLGPVNQYEGLNNMSLVLRLDYGSTSFLFTGDAEAPSEQDMMKAHSPMAFSADVLKLGHHGSSTSTTKAFLSAVSPSFAIASCGENNEYGHPHTEILSATKRANITLLRTDLDGTVILTSDGSRVTRLQTSTHS